MAICCPQCSGALRQQLLSMHGIAWYCMVLHGIAWYCMVLHGIAWYYMVLHGMASCGILHYLALSSIKDRCDLKKWGWVISKSGWLLELILYFYSLLNCNLKLKAVKALFALFVYFCIMLCNLESFSPKKVSFSSHCRSYSDSNCSG